MEDVKKLEKNLNDSQEALYDAMLELGELEIALNELLSDYDTDFALNHMDLVKYANGDEKNEVGKKSYAFMYEHKRIMWFIRTAAMYCRSAKEICEMAQL